MTITKNGKPVTVNPNTAAWRDKSKLIKKSKPEPKRPRANPTPDQMFRAMTKKKK